MIGLAAGIGSLAGIAFATNASMDYAGNGVFYDVTVCSLFCDYDDISDAYDTEGADKSYYIRGDFTETDDIDIPANTRNTWDDVVVTSSAQLTSTADNWTSEGNLDFTTTYDDSSYIVNFTGTDNVDSRALIKSTWSGATTTQDNHSAILLSTIDNSRFNLYAPTDSYALQDTSWDAIGVYLYDTDDSFIQVQVEPLTVAQSAALGTVGAQIQECDDSDIHVLVNGVNTTSGNTGVGVKVIGGADCNIHGNSVNNDGTPLNGGAGHYTATLNT